jgi:hypothetical protein
MSQSLVINSSESLKLFKRDTLVKGQPAQLDCVDILGQTYSVARGPATMVSLEDEWYEDVRDPVAVIETLSKDSEIRADIFTFWQRIPDTEPKYKYEMEWESVAVLPVTTHGEWISKHISSRTRSMIRKSLKEGVEVRECPYDDEFVRGMTEIFNEAAVRQGRKFWHYGKDFETIKRQFGRYIFREYMIGAYFNDELIGFIMLGNAGRFGLTGQIISKIKHRDKATNNVLISKAVEVCEQRKLPYLVYLYWTNDSLAEFKRRCGFQETKVPRYFVPITQKGKMALRTGLHRGWKAALPDRIVQPLKKLRRMWYGWRE